MRSFTTCFVAALALLPAAAHADDADADRDAIVVTATRSETRLDEVGKSIGLTDAETIERRQTVSLADLLRTQPGVAIQRNGGLGGVTSVFIRGAQSDHTVALIDGVKLNDPAAPGGGFNFADLLTDNIERIEILRGPQSVLWGSQAIGGVINVITSEPGEEMSVRARAEYGRYDSGHLTGAVTGRVGPVALSAGAGYLTTDGISAAASGREADGYHLFGAHLKARTDLSERVSLDLRGFYTKSKVELDGFPPPAYAFADTGEYQRQEQIVGYAGLNVALLDGRLRNRLAANWTRVDRANYDPAGAPVKNYDTRGSNLRFEYQGIADLGFGEATFGAEHQQERLRSVGSFAPLAREKANLDSLYLDLRAKPVAGVTLGGGLRYDHHSQFGDATTAGADLVYTPNGGDTLFRASYAEGFKAPTLYQLYSDYGTPGLRPERAKGWDAGITQRLIGDKVQLRATWFERRTTDLIDFDFVTFTYANIARARARGAELELSVAPTPELLFAANYSYTNTRNREPGDANFGRHLPRRPRHVVNVSGDYRWPFGLSTGATITQVADSFDDPANAVRLDGHVLVDLRLAMPLNDHVELYGRIENLFDERYQTAAGYGQLGRAATAGIRLRY